MVTSEYNVAHVDEIPVIRMAEIDDVPEKFDRIGVQNLDEERLATEEMKVKVWHVPSGEQMGIHGNPTQEEFYYVLDGTFRIHIGPAAVVSSSPIDSVSVSGSERCSSSR